LFQYAKWLRWGRVKCETFTENGRKDMTIPHMTFSFRFQWGLGHIHCFSYFLSVLPIIVNDRSLRSNAILLALKLYVLLVLFIVFAFLNDKPFFNKKIRVIVTFNFLESTYNIFSCCLLVLGVYHDLSKRKVRKIPHG